MDDKEQILSMMHCQTHPDGLEDWEPTFDENGALILDDRPTPSAAFRALLRIATELKRLVDCAPSTENGIRVDNRNAFRMTTEKLWMVGTLANSPHFQLTQHDTPAPGIATSHWSPTYAGASIVSIVNDVCLRPFGESIRDKREIDREAIDLFTRRFNALNDFVATLPKPDDPDYQPITAFPLQLRARIRQATTPKRKSLRVRKQGKGKDAQYSRVDVIRNWEDDYQRWRKSPDGGSAV